MSSPTPHLRREMGLFRSWAAAFGFVSIATGIFTAYGSMLSTSGYAGIWTWVIVAIGQFSVAVIFGILASRIPVTGYSYQWISRLTNPVFGWIMGWLSFSFLSVVVVAVDYTVASTILPALIGPVSVGDAWVITSAIMLVQFGLIATSTRVALRVNGIAVIFELIGVVGLIALLFIVGAITGGMHVENLFDTTPFPAENYLSFGTLNNVGPWMLATLLGSFTIVGFETAANLAEETKNPHRTVPVAMMISVGSVGVLGMLLLIAVTLLGGDPQVLAQSVTPMADVVSNTLGSVVGALLLIAVIISIFSCGLMIMLSNSRLVWAMSRDERFPAWKAFSRISPKRRTPLWAALFVVIVGQAILAIFSQATDALFVLFSAGSLIPALIYAGTVGMFVYKRRTLPAAPKGALRIPKWVELLVTVIAVAWLVFELAIFRDEMFAAPWAYVCVMVGVGAIYLTTILVKRGGVRGLTMPDLSSIDAAFESEAGEASEEGEKAPAAAN